MNKIKVLVTIKSNKIQAGKDSIHYKVNLNDDNKYTTQFYGTLIGNALPRFGNSDEKELFRVERESDKEIIECTYNQFSEFIYLESESSNGNVETVTGSFVNNTDPNNPIITNPDIGDIEGLQDSIDNKADLVHSHIISDINNLQTELDNKQNIGDYATNTDLNNGLNTKSNINHTHAMSNVTGLEDSLNNKVDNIEGQGLSPEPFTDDEKAKLAGLEDPKFQGQFGSITELNNANVGGIGNYAYVDGGVGNPVDLYIWNNSDSQWDIVAGEPTAETPASIKSKYESNPDTNSFTDSEKSKLASMTGLFTTALKTAYDSSVTWISTNGANLLNHLSNKNNPHNVTKNQVGLGNVDNTSDVNKPISTLVQSALTDLSNNKQDKLIEGSGITIVDNVISATGGGSGTGGEVLTSKVFLTPAQLKDFSYKPIELIPNPGPDRLINVLSCTVLLDFNTTVYNYSSTYSNVINIRYMTESGSFYGTDIANASNAFRVNTRSLGKLMLNQMTGPSKVSNHSVVLINIGPNATVGDSNATVIVNYIIDDFN